MNSVNQTLYIPLYGKAYVSRKGLFLHDPKAEEIWEKASFALRGQSKWLAYYMGIRAAVFDEWTRQQMTAEPDAVVLHIGCGLDSRVLRVARADQPWYDVDFPEVIAERKRFYLEDANYRMVAGDARECTWLAKLPKARKAIVVMEGVSMYLTNAECRAFVAALQNHFGQVALLMDCYTVLAAKMSKIKNPVKEVGVLRVYGVDQPEVFEAEGIAFVREHEMTPQKQIDELQGMEKRIFAKLYAGGFSRKLYRLFEYRTVTNGDK